MADPSDFVETLKGCGSAILYGSPQEALGVAGKLVENSDDLVALVDCEQLRRRHTHVAMKSLGESSYGYIKGIGFVPDLVVASCKSLREAAGLLEWTTLGSRLVCIVNPKRSEHADWSMVREFSVQAFCCADGTVIAQAMPTS